MIRLRLADGFDDEAYLGRGERTAMGIVADDAAIMKLIDSNRSRMLRAVSEIE